MEKSLFERVVGPGEHLSRCFASNFLAVLLHYLLSLREYCVNDQVVQLNAPWTLHLPNTFIQNLFQIHNTRGNSLAFLGLLYHNREG